jgi:vacuolar-type H+-ATPase subunit H
MANDTLARLLVSEEQSAARMASARAEAEGIVQKAREDAQRTEDACVATIEERLAELARKSESTLASDLEAIRREAAGERSRFEGIGADRTRAYVEFIIGRLLPEETPPPEMSR